MVGGAWPFLVGGVICQLNCVNERDLRLLNFAPFPIRLSGCIPETESHLVSARWFRFFESFLEGLLMSFIDVVRGSGRQ